MAASIAQWLTRSTLKITHANEREISRLTLRVTTQYRESRGNQMPVAWTITAAIPMTPAHDSNYSQDVAASEDIIGQWSSPEQAIMAIYNDSQMIYHVLSESEFMPANNAATRKDWLSNPYRDHDDFSPDSDYDSNGYATNVSRRENLSRKAHPRKFASQ